MKAERSSSESRFTTEKMIEAVLLVDRKGRHTACLSVRVGCAIGCTFCKTGTMERRS